MPTSCFDNLHLKRVLHQAYEERLAQGQHSHVAEPSTQTKPFGHSSQTVTTGAGPHVGGPASTIGNMGTALSPPSGRVSAISTRSRAQP